MNSYDFLARRLKMMPVNNVMELTDNIELAIARGWLIHEPTYYLTSERLHNNAIRFSDRRSGKKYMMIIMEEE